MRVPSLLKLEKQVEAWMRSQVFVCSDLRKKIDEAEAAVIKLRAEWIELRDKFCAGSPCICQAHPRYEELVIRKLQPAIAEMEALHRQVNKRMNAARSAKMAELMRGREARLRYLARAQ
jgi:hypothetical protein